MVYLACLALFSLPIQVPVEGALKMDERWIIEMSAEASGQKLRLLLSTGAERTILSPRAYFRVTGDSVADDKISQSKALHDLQIGGVSVGRSRIIGANLDLFKQGVDEYPPFDGILGRDFISQRIWFLDYEQRRFKVLPAEMQADAVSVFLPKEKMALQPAIHKATVGYFLGNHDPKRLGDYMVDTGSSILAINSTILSIPKDLLTLPTPYPNLRFSDGPLLGVHGRSLREDIGRLLSELIPTLKLGTYTIHCPVAYHFPVHPGEAHGVVGPYVMGMRAIAFFPNGALGLWDRNDRDYHLSRALQRVFGLYLNVDRDKLFVTTDLPEDEGRNFPVKSLLGRSPAEIIALIQLDDPAVLREWSILWGPTCEVEIWKDGKVQKLRLATEVRS